MQLTGKTEICVAHCVVLPYLSCHVHVQLYTCMYIIHCIDLPIPFMALRNTPASASGSMEAGPLMVPWPCSRFTFIAAILVVSCTHGSVCVCVCVCNGAHFPMRSLSFWEGALLLHEKEHHHCERPYKTNANTINSDNVHRKHCKYYCKGTS